ncbi:Asp-tRNA(Asn)/Glu-tRNA(Gln) amidotransferase subunit GatC [Candidatus Stoquefichus massiliensis]|uniref:Asp-tRNA(Asn)/Glu-tRNA(Gln) amidotransferase subunit GatC n=1 Tax=Candidatus Stoquefichus massiliensis TaxID=1470350 RepID=UPI000489846B|nr:Asp-tRNA(Asn)/Glu-tRNA(Gln) amidotransferase subunit GatC [Candidatus Stoquefichus massiliensis]
MNETEMMLKQLGRKTMFDVSDEEMPALIEEYDVFMSHVKALEAIDTTGVEPLAFPYEIETTFLREDELTYTIHREEALQNAKSVQDNQIKVPKVVG